MSDGSRRRFLIVLLALFVGSYIYDEILAHRRIPSNRFSASAATMRQPWDATARLRAGP